MDPALDFGVAVPTPPPCGGPCTLCLVAPARYTCPRCQASYCALPCYRGPRHRRCSEAFYREEVLGALRGNRGVAGDIQGVLKRAWEAQLREEGEGGLLGCLEEGNLAGQLDTDREGDMDAHKEDERALGEGALDHREDPQGLWETLTPAEKREFLQLLESGGLGALLSPWQPWWEKHERPCLVQEELGGGQERREGADSLGCPMLVVTRGVEEQGANGPKVRGVNGEAVLAGPGGQQEYKGVPTLRNVIVGGSEVYQEEKGATTPRNINGKPMLLDPGRCALQEKTLKVKNINEGPMLEVPGAHMYPDEAPTHINVIMGGPGVQKQQEKDPILRNINEKSPLGGAEVQKQQDTESLKTTEGLKMSKRQDGTSARATRDTEAQKQPDAVVKLRSTSGLEGQTVHGSAAAMPYPEQTRAGGIEVQRDPERAGSKVTTNERHADLWKQQEASLGQRNGKTIEVGKTEQVAPPKQTHITGLGGLNRKDTFHRLGIAEVQQQKKEPGEVAPPKQRELDCVEHQNQSRLKAQQNTPDHGQRADFKKRTHGKEISGDLPTANHVLVPPLPKAVPSLSSLTRNPSPLVKFNLVNALYAYAFGLKLYNGDLGEDFLLQEFCDTVLAVSGTLGATRFFGSTAEALQAGIQAVLARGRHGDPQGAAMAVVHILIGGSSDRRKDYTLAALSHLTGLLGRARKLAPKKERQRIYNAKKKCEFLLSWANGHEDTLTLLSVEVQSEYNIYVASLKEVELLSSELEKSWRGKKPPEKKVLIQELE